MLKKFIYNYTKFILKLELYPKWWPAVRFILNWITLPIKLFVIGSMGIYQIIYQTLFFRTRHINPQTNENKEKYLRFMYSKLPVVRNINEELYVNRVPYYEKPNGYNQNIDHQASRHGTYTFLMSQIDKRNGFQEMALARHMFEHKLYRGYNWADKVNENTVSGDMLIGTALGVLNTKGSIKVGSIASSGGSAEALMDAYYELISNFVRNDYSLLEGNKSPEDGPEKEAFDEEVKRKLEAGAVRLKSTRGMLSPGLEPVGAQAITALCALRVGDRVCGSLLARKAYVKLLYKYGYGLLSLFPTAFIQSKRGYFNDHNVMVGLYILAKLSDGKLGRLFWTFPMIYTFLLSYKWRNGYFTGLLLDVAPWMGIFLKYHKEQCINYLYEEMPIAYARYGGFELPASKGLPIKFNDMNQDEFHPDQEHYYFTNKAGGDDIIRTDNYHSGLGFFAHAIMLEKEFVKETLKK